MTHSTSSSKQPTHCAYQVRETPSGKSFWNRIGVAWTNRDGGLTLQLESVPLDGRILLQLAKKEEDSETSATPAV
jgi:hypothetical protein